MEGTFVLALIAREFRLAPAPGRARDPAVRPAISLRPAHGIRLRIEQKTCDSLRLQRTRADW